MMTAVSTGRLKKGSTLLIASVGAGFTSGASVLKWSF
jgi:3-oxoacyl-[acyl-carrier-protein] synthase-3